MIRKATTSVKPDDHKVVDGEIANDLEDINSSLKSIMVDNYERILFRPILAYKIKPDKNAFLGMLQANWRYLMFSNRKLYNMDPKVYNDGDVDKRKLIKNQIDISCLTHLIFAP